MEKKSVTFKGNLETVVAVKYLEELAKDLKEGKVCIQQKDQFVTLKPASQVEMELSATQKKEKQKLSIELCWKKPKTVTKNKSLDLIITAKEPEIKKIEVTPEKKNPVKGVAVKEEKTDAKIPVSVKTDAKASTSVPTDKAK